jgi:hypothetical protein
MRHIPLQNQVLTNLPKPCKMSLMILIGSGPGGSAWGVD